jgi:SAM-dependent methyltransferase
VRPPLDYLALRLIRRAMPQAIVEWMLTNQVVIRPGLETGRPESALARYQELASVQLPIAGSRILVFGYGGTYGIALALLEQGAAHVYLHDPYASVRHSLNRRLPQARLQRYFSPGNGNWIPDPRYVTILTDQLPDVAKSLPDSVDFVLSNSVFEHVEDVPANVKACAAITKPRGYNLHLIDLRDHFFKYPFEMLRYSEDIWRSWLNASNNLNRWRYKDYEGCFAGAFRTCKARRRTVLMDQFNAMRASIRNEFLTGDDQIDAAGLMLVECWK